MTSLSLGERALTLDDLQLLLGDAPPTLTLDPAAAERVRASRGVVDEAMAAGRTCYGINTGFGKLSSERIDAADLRDLQVNLVRSHAAGLGDPLPLPVCRLALALRATNLARGHSGVRTRLVEHVLAVFNAGIVPVLPSQGSVGASGDLAPLAHMALVLIGEGRAWYDGDEVDGGEALRAAGLQPIELQSKEGLALLNGTQVSTSVLVDALLVARRLVRTATLATATTLEAYRGTGVAYDERIHALRGQPGQTTVAAWLRRALEGSAVQASHAERGYRRVQDPYCLRCVPQVHGASLDAIDYVSGVVEREVNAVTDNPLVFEGGDILSGGNFHAQPVAVAADLLKIAVAEIANIAERRIELLNNPDVSGLPAFLAPGRGLHSGMMIAHVAAAALVSENKVLAHPASVDSIPTSAGKEDHVSMATHAARQARAMVENSLRVTAIELNCAFHALALQEDGLDVSPGVQAVREALDPILEPLVEDRVLSDDLEAVADVVRDGSLLASVEVVLGALE